MELLAPAGSMEQAVLAIEAGCNALYGGLTKWNARMNATNFTLKEYNALLHMCHERNVKFYLTLNTLLRDDELQELLRLFGRHDFLFPDAIIVADMGLISSMSEKFPMVDIHASTQFGTCSLADIHFLQKYNVKRVILARELTLSEIARLRKDTDMELEVFVYGSQCLCFSGQCLWGGLTQERSGNRGRCPAPCRDFYSSGDKSGQLLYPRDINASTIIDVLAETGIDSVKIEGRFRNSQQIASAVKFFRERIDQAPCYNTAATKNYVGYLGNKLPVKGMLACVNPRTNTCTFENVDYIRDDYLAVQQSDGVVVKNAPDVAKARNKRYVKTIASQPLSPLNDGAVLTLSFVDTVLIRLDCVDNVGRPYSYELNKTELQAFKVSDIFSYIRGKVKFKSIDITSNMPTLAEVYCHKGSLINIIDELNAKVNQVSKPHLEKLEPPKCEDLIAINNAKMFLSLKAKGYRKFLFDTQSMPSLQEILSLEEVGDNIVYRLPILDFNGYLNQILSYLHSKTVMVTRWSHLLLKDEYSFKPLYADFTLNVWNCIALSSAATFGVRYLVSHPEMSLQESASLAKRHNLGCAYIYAGRIPIGYTRACFGELRLCDKKCGQSFFEVKNITKGYNVKVYCNNELGYRTLASSFLNVAGATSPDSLRIFDFIHLNESEIANIMSTKANDVNTLSPVYWRSVL